MSTQQPLGIRGTHAYSRRPKTVDCDCMWDERLHNKDTWNVPLLALWECWKHPGIIRWIDRAGMPVFVLNFKSLHKILVYFFFYW